MIRRNAVAGYSHILSFGWSWLRLSPRIAFVLYSYVTVYHDSHTSPSSFAKLKKCVRSDCDTTSRFLVMHARRKGRGPVLLRIYPCFSVLDRVSAAGFRFKRKELGTKYYIHRHQLSEWQAQRFGGRYRRLSEIVQYCHWWTVQLYGSPEHIYMVLNQNAVLSHPWISCHCILVDFSDSPESASLSL